MGTVASEWVIMSYFFYWRNVIFRVWLIPCQRIMNLRAWKLPQNWGYACIIGIHRFTLSKLWGRFSQLSVFPKNRFIKNDRTKYVFMLQIWLAYQNLDERIRNKNSALDFTFSAQFFLYGPEVEKNGFQFFSIRRLTKKNSDIIEKKQSWFSLPYAFGFILIGESYLYYKNSPTSILFSRVGKRCFFPRKMQKTCEKR